MAGKIMLAPTSPATAPVDLSCWCGHGVWEMAFRTARFGLLRCPGCGAHRIDPPPIRSDRESQDFYSTYYAEAGAGRQALNGLETREPSGFRKVAEQHPELWRPGSR